MDSRVEAVLAEYDERAAREWALMRDMSLEETMQRVDEFLISIGPDTGTLLNVLIKGARSRTIVEIGTSYGHSTVFLAEAARAGDGHVISIDVSAALAAWLATVHDLASAQLARDDRPHLPRAIAHGLRASSALVTLAQVGLGALALLAFVLGDFSGRSLGWPAAALAVTQIAALATTFIHALWLNVALDKTSQPF